MSEAPLNVAVFASGGGSNLQALLDHQGSAWRVAVLICNRKAGAMDRARDAGVAAVVVPTKDRSSADVAEETLAVLDEHNVSIILLAGYLRLLPEQVTDRYAGRILNIHPALLPDFGGKGMYGMNVHRAVIESGVDTTGATVHFVTKEYDEGAVLGQWHVSVRPGDTPEDVAARVLQIEHQLYPKAVDHLCAALAAGTEVEPMPSMRIEEPPTASEEVQ